MIWSGQGRLGVSFVWVPVCLLKLLAKCVSDLALSKVIRFLVASWVEDRLLGWRDHEDLRKDALKWAQYLSKLWESYQFGRFARKFVLMWRTRSNYWLSMAIVYAVLQEEMNVFLNIWLPSYSEIIANISESTFVERVFVFYIYCAENVKLFGFSLYRVKKVFVIFIICRKIVLDSEKFDEKWSIWEQYNYLLFRYSLNILMNWNSFRAMQ